MGAPLPNLQRSFLARKKGGGRGGHIKGNIHPLYPHLVYVCAGSAWKEEGQGWILVFGKVVLPRCKSVY